MTDKAVDVARSLVARLLDLGVTDAVLAPGSRSGPLALALHAADLQNRIRLHVRIDEREAAFLALGLAKTSHHPVPVVTTSGTAAANLYPALLEAFHAGVPVIAVTADRPPRLRGTGANQTTHQPSMFGVVRTAAAIAELDEEPRPSHLNLELDEPLIEPVSWSFMSAGSLEPAPPPRLATPLAVGPRTVVVAGDDAGRRARQVAEAGRWPLLAEPSSGSRTGEAPLIAYSLLLPHLALARSIERVVSFGHATLSRSVLALLSRTDIEIVHVGDQGTFPVPAGDNVTFVDAVDVDGEDDFGWWADWQYADQCAVEAIDKVLEPDDPQRVAATVWDALPPDGLLVLGSSSPIRDVDLMAEPHDVGERRLVLANRGLAGIDGVLSTAVGAALARQSSRALAYVGDLTFLHGSNGLLIGQAERRPDLTIVVASDDGGSIFGRLEQGAAEYAGSFERIYATPTGASIADVCAAYGIGHHRVAPQGLAPLLAEPVEGITVLEVPVDRFRRRELDARLAEAVRTTVL